MCQRSTFKLTLSGTVNTMSRKGLSFREGGGGIFVKTLLYCTSEGHAYNSSIQCPAATEISVHCLNLGEKIMIKMYVKKQILLYFTGCVENYNNKYFILLYIRV